MHPPLSLEEYAKEARAWLFGKAAPLWSNSGRLANGLFAEALDIAGQPVSLPLRTRVQARQIYVFSELGRLGWDGNWRDAVEKSLAALLANGRREDGFFVHTLSDSGAPIDRRADLYDHAFILFCLANAGEALGQPSLYSLGDEIMDLIERRWRHPLGGFSEGEIDGAPRRQNPHMHLLEAVNAMSGYTGRPRWKIIAEEILALCAEKFIEPETRALTEYFTEDWEPIAGDEGKIVEPGHCFEWAWLFEGMASSGHTQCIGLSDGLTSFARDSGIVAGRVINEVLISGEVHDGGLRVWPQTECLKAGLSRFRRTRNAQEATLAETAFASLRHHLDVPIDGLWRERRDAQGNWLTQPAPASTFYHIVCALSELFKILK